jgi:hypothetical protein
LNGKDDSNELDDLTYNLTRTPAKSGHKKSLASARLIGGGE